MSSPLRHTDSTTNLQQRRLFWDSSDPTRNPPALPMQPDSPQLNATGGPSKPGSPLKQSFGMRHLLNSSQAEEKLNSVYDGTVKLQESLTDVGDRIREAMVEFGELAYRSHDNGVALTSLKEKLSSTQATAARSASDISDGLAHMNTALESIGERQNVATQASTQVLDYIRDVARRIKGLEATLEATAGAGFEGKRGVDSQESLELLASVIQNFKSLDSQHGELAKFLASFEAESKSHAGDVSNHLEEVGAKIDRLSSSAAESKHLADKMLQKITDEADVGRQVSVQIEDLKIALDGIERAVASRPDIDIGKLRQDLLDKLADGHEALVEQVKRMRAVETGAADSKEVQCTVKALEQNLGTRIGHIADAVKQTDESLLSTRKHISELMAVTLRDHSEKQREELSKLQKELEESITKSYAGLSKSFKEDRSAHVTLMQDKHDELKKSLISKEEVEEKHAALVKGLEATHGIVNKSIDSGLQPVLEQLDTLAKSQKELSERTAAASHGQHALDALAEKQQQQLKQVEQVVSQQLDRLSELMSVASNNQEMDKIVAKAETEAAVSAVRDEVQQVISSQLEKLSVSFVSDIKGIVGSTASDVRELHNLLDAQKSEIASIRGDIAKVLAIGVEEDKSVASGLRKEIQEMRAEKERLISQLGDLKAEIRVRGEEFDKLELRVTQFETRLNSTILDHSRSILGSATVAIINNGGRASAAAPASGDSDRQPMSKRNLSMIPGDQIHQDPTNDNDKENELTVAKRGSPFTSAKLRSISMFQGH